MSSLPDSDAIHTDLETAHDHASQPPVEPFNTNKKSASDASPALMDIEHAIVHDDPRQWSRFRKYLIVAVISAAAMVAGLGGNLYNPAISQIESQLHAVPSQISLTLSLFILIQGVFPAIIWSGMSEVYGRRFVYLISLVICTVGCIVAATAKTIQILIGARVLQAAGSSAVMAIGAATLADIFDPHERGTMMGVYYCAPLLGPSLGPILGGVLTQGFNWRATFWFLAIFTGVCALSFLLFKDTFRKERSTIYQGVLKRIIAQRAAELTKRAERKDTSGSATPNEKDVERQVDVAAVVSEAVKEVRVTLKDLNPVKPILQVLQRKNNAAVLVGSGLLFAFNFSVTYTAARTLANQYHYDALKTGLVLLAYGAGCLFGSILGGRYSDFSLARLKQKNGGKSYPEMRLDSTRLPMLFFPPAVVGYGWICEENQSIAAVCVMLFLAGFFQISIYSSTLAYIVDANVGRSSSAVATNSLFRGISAFVATEVAVPLQDSIGDGGMYSFWAGIGVIAELLILLAWWKGGKWREQAIAKENAKASRS